MKNNQSFIPALLIVGMIILSSCASIVSKSAYPLKITSVPTNAAISISNLSGSVIYTGTTPASVELRAAQGFFKREQYAVTFKLDGYADAKVPVYFKVDGWYWGNLLFGGVLGFLIIDPATGAMYKLATPMITQTLSPNDGYSLNTPQLEILDINDIPEELRNNLVLLEKLETKN